jgi:hypothetical protein
MLSDSFRGCAFVKSRQNRIERHPFAADTDHYPSLGGKSVIGPIHNSSRSMSLCS